MKKLACVVLLGLLVAGLVGCETGGSGDLAPTISGGNVIECPGPLGDVPEIVCVAIEYQGAVAGETGYLGNGGDQYEATTNCPNEKDCSFALGFVVPPGTYDLWVVDEQGRESNHLEVTI